MGQKVNALAFRLGLNRDWEDSWHAEGEYTASLHKDLLTKKYLTRVFREKDVLVGTIQIQRSLLQTHVSFPFHPLEKKVSGKGARRAQEAGREVSAPMSIPSLPNLPLSFSKIHAGLKIINGPETYLHPRALGSVTQKKRWRVEKRVSTALRPYRDRSFFLEGVKVMAGALGLGSASLLSRYFASELEKDRRHNNFIRFVHKALPLFLKASSGLQGIRIQWKGRLNGSERSKTQVLTCGRVSFHTLAQEMDLGYTPTFTPYGVCSVKIWMSFAPRGPYPKKRCYDLKV
jgi:ribosomal protein S3